jgi:hypothetical protein
MLSSVRIDKHQPIDRIVNRGEIRQEIQTLGRVVAGAEEIKHIALVAQAECALDQDDVVSLPLQAPSEGELRDPGAANQGSHSCRVDEISCDRSVPESPFPGTPSREAARAPARSQRAGVPTRSEPEAPLKPRTSSFDRSFRRNEEMAAAILRPAGFGLAPAERRFLAETSRDDAIGVDSQAGQIVADHNGAAIAQRQVVFGGASLVAMPLNEKVRLRPLPQPRHVPL